MEDTVRKRRSYQRRWVKAKRLKLKQGTYSTSDNTDSHEEESSFADSMEGSSSVIAAVPVLESEESLSQLSSSTDNEADEISDDEDRGVIFRNRLAVWASECNITQGNTERLLRLMKDFKETDVFKDLPKTARTLQSSLRSVDLGCKSSMQYYYLGLRNELGKVIQSLPKKLHCYFPKTNATERAKKCVPPKLDSNWPLHMIKIIGPETDDWKVAKQWLSKSEYTSNLDTSGSETENSRIRRPPKRLYESSDNEITEDLSSSAAPATKKIATEWDNQSVNVSTNDVANNPGPGQVELVDNESASSTMFEKNEVSFSRNSTSAASGTIVEGNLEYDVRDAVGQMQDAIGQMQDGIGQMQATLSSLEPIIMEISHSVKGRRNSKKPSDLIVQDIIPVTMTTNEDLKAFDKKLQQNKEFASDAIIGFSSVGGDNIGQTVRFILKKVASAGVWSCYSRVGKNAKEAFSDLALDKIIYRACKKIHGRTFSEKDYIRVVGEALRHFPSQKGGSRWKGVEKKRSYSSYLSASSEDET